MLSDVIAGQKSGGIIVGLVVVDAAGLKMHLSDTIQIMHSTAWQSWMQADCIMITS